MTILQTSSTGFSLPIKLNPGAAHDRIDGWVDDADGQPVLRVHVRAVPEKGKANAALLKILAKRMGIGKTRLIVTRGQTSRIKTVSVKCEANEAEALVAKLTELDT